MQPIASDGCDTIRNEETRELQKYVSRMTNAQMYSNAQNIQKDDFQALIFSFLV